MLKSDHFLRKTSVLQANVDHSFHEVGLVPSVARDVLRRGSRATAKTQARLKRADVLPKCGVGADLEGRAAVVLLVREGVLDVLLAEDAVRQPYFLELNEVSRVRLAEKGFWMFRRAIAQRTRYRWVTLHSEKLELSHVFAHALTGAQVEESNAAFRWNTLTEPEFQRLSRLSPRKLHREICTRFEITSRWIKRAWWLG